MENTQDFLNGLDKLTFVDYKDKVLHTKEGFEISYALELMSSALHIMPIQFQVRISKDGVYVMTWGCGDNKDVELCVKWWQKREWDAYTYKSDKKDLKLKELRAQFNQLTK
jgi:hypothetical protein